MRNREGAVGAQLSTAHSSFEIKFTHMKQRESDFMNQAVCNAGHLIPQSDGRMTPEFKSDHLQKTRHDNRVACHSQSIPQAGAKPLHG